MLLTTMIVTTRKIGTFFNVAQFIVINLVIILICLGNTTEARKQMPSLIDDDTPTRSYRPGKFEFNFFYTHISFQLIRNICYCKASIKVVHEWIMPLEQRVKNTTTNTPISNKTKKNIFFEMVEPNVSSNKSLRTLSSNKFQFSHIINLRQTSNKQYSIQWKLKCNHFVLTIYEPLNPMKKSRNWTMWITKQKLEQWTFHCCFELKKK